MPNYVPTSIALSVNDIDYNKLYADGKRIILFDLDNTLISYYEKEASEEKRALAKKLLDMGFETYVLTNNHKKRISAFINTFKATDYGFEMRKPSSKRIDKYLKEKNITDYTKVVMVGDQLVTDVLCANRLGVDSVLVKSISRESEHFYTRINRLREKGIVRNIAKTNPSYAKEIEKIVKKEKK